MSNLNILNADDAELNTVTEVPLSLRFVHPKVTSSEEAAALSRAALVDYAEAYGLDIYQRDEEGNRTRQVDDAAILPALNAYLVQHVLTIVASHRGSRAEAEARAAAASTLLAG